MVEEGQVLPRRVTAASIHLEAKDDNHERSGLLNHRGHSTCILFFRFSRSHPARYACAILHSNQSRQQLTPPIYEHFCFSQPYLLTTTLIHPRLPLDPRYLQPQPTRRCCHLGPARAITPTLPFLTSSHLPLPGALPHACSSLALGKSVSTPSLDRRRVEKGSETAEGAWPEERLRRGSGLAPEKLQR